MGSYIQRDMLKENVSDSFVQFKYRDYILLENFLYFPE